MSWPGLKSRFRRANTTRWTECSRAGCARSKPSRGSGCHFTTSPRSSNDQCPAFIAPHGHDKLGLHSYAGAFRNKKHREEILAREGHIAAQAARRGFVAIAPATRGLANEVLVPDPKGRHGNRPCRAQLVHCLLSGRTPTAERVWDMQRILDWAVKQPEVDPKKIIMTGNSGGGVLTAYTAAIDTRVTVAIPSCSFTSVTTAEGYVFHCDCCLVPGLRNWGDWKELAGLIAPRRLLLVHGGKGRPASPPNGRCAWPGGEDDLRLLRLGRPHGTQVGHRWPPVLPGIYVAVHRPSIRAGPPINKRKVGTAVPDVLGWRNCDRPLALCCGRRLARVRSPWIKSDPQSWHSNFVL